MPGNERADALAGKAAEVAYHLPGPYEAPSVREVSEEQRKMGQGPPPSWVRRDPTPSAKKVVYGPGEKRHSVDGRTDQKRPLALRSLSQEDKKEERRQMLVLRGRGQDDQIPRPTPLPQRHASGS
jgi:hypothetical protein